jgi:hypothetical protein
VSGQRGQAAVELLAGAAVAAVAGLVAFQLLGAGYAAVMADHAVEAAAIAAANGRPPSRAAREALPGWPGRALRVRVERDRVRVVLVPPSPLRMLRGRLKLTATSALPAPPADAGPGRGLDEPQLRRAGEAP